MNAALILGFFAVLLAGAAVVLVAMTWLGVRDLLAAVQQAHQTYAQLKAGVEGVLGLVQAPRSTFEAEVLMTLARLDERVLPPPVPETPPLDAVQQEALIQRILREAVDFANQAQKANNANGVAFKGYDKRKVALEYAESHLKAATVSINWGTLAQRLEAEVASRG